MLPESGDWVAWGVFGALLAVAAGYDVAQRRIPNWAVLLLLAAYGVLAALDMLRFDPVGNLVGLLVAFAGAYGLWTFKVIGGGDAKLFAATALFAGLGNLWLLFATTAIAGGAVALVAIALRARGRIAQRGLHGMVADGMSAAAVAGAHPDIPVRALYKQGRDNPTKGIPYGVAIAVGALVTAQITGFLHDPRVARHLNARDLAPLVQQKAK